MSNRLKGKLFGFAIVAFIISMFFSYVELDYWLHSRWINATITTLKVRVNPQNEQEQGVDIIYQFTEPNGTERIDSDEMPARWRPPNFNPQSDQNKVRVEYTPGEKGRSRIAGNSHEQWLIVLGVMLVAMLYFGIATLLQIRKDYRS